VKIDVYVTLQENTDMYGRPDGARLVRAASSPPAVNANQRCVKVTFALPEDFFVNKFPTAHIKVPSQEPEPVSVYLNEGATGTD
jgi:hypothetical protein